MNAEKMTFLLVEDDPNDVHFVQLAFREAPNHIQLRHVRDGQEAIEYLEGRGRYADRMSFPLPCVIMLDLKMPRVSGFDFLKWLHQDSPGKLHLIPVIVMSSSNLPKDVERAYELGVNSYITKPVDWGTFRERLKTLGIYWGEHAEVPQLSNHN